MDDKPLIQALKTHNIRGLDTLLDHEYISLYSIQTNPIPIISYLDGKVSNFGSKLAYSSQFRIGTENTVIGINDLNKGIIPYGLMYLLSRVENGIGYYIALTGHEFKQQELFDMGIVSHYSSSAMKYLLHKTCYELSYRDLSIQDSHLCSISTGNIGDVDRFEDYSDMINVFKKCMYNDGGDTFSELLRRLELTNTEWSKRTLEEIYSKPLVLSKLCYELLSESRRHSYHTVCQLERQIASVLIIIIIITLCYFFIIEYVTSSRNTRIYV